MRIKDTFDVMTSILGILLDAASIFFGFLLASWIVFDTGWFAQEVGLFSLPKGIPPTREIYWYGSGMATLLYLFIFNALHLYVRPQSGSFGEKIPRLFRACVSGLLLSLALGFIIRTDPEFSRKVIAVSFLTVTLLVLIQRYILFRLERHWAKHRPEHNRVIVLGTDEIAWRIKQALRREPRMRSKVIGFLRTGNHDPFDDIPRDSILGDTTKLPELIENNEVDAVILADYTLPREEMTSLFLACEKGLVSFSMIPDLFRVLTDQVEVQSIEGIPLLGVGKWPLDYFWNRVLKRSEDIVGSVAGLILSAPVMAIAAVIIKSESPGPIFFQQERLGEKGKPFMLFKLRTMRKGAETETGPVWASKEDPRRTRCGAFMRRYNIDELPQFWNVIRGEMSLVGPRPERQYFVDQFKEDLGTYMWRHVAKPGITGWAQVNGFRGNTSIKDRIKYDLFYLENWSLSLDFKVLAKTFFSRENAY